MRTNSEPAGNHLQFNSPEFGLIRTAGTPEQPLFCAADVCTALGYANPRKTITDHVDEGDVTKCDTLTNGGIQSISFVNESGLYALIFGSKLQRAKAFKCWVTSEVLPAIRKTGGYMTSNPADSDADIMARALVIAQATLERRDQQIKQLTAENLELAPKAKYFDRVMQSKVLVTTTQIAADYGMSAMKFNALLNRLRVQRKVNDQWILYAPYNTMGYVHSETFIPANSTSGKVVMQTKWTQKGRLFLYKVFKSKGVLPVIEREDDMPAGLLAPTYSTDVEHVTR